jgi:hypothetical protein
MPPKKAAEEEAPATGARFGRVKNNLKVRRVDVSYAALCRLGRRHRLRAA